MNRHCSEGRTDSKNADILYYIFLLLFPLNINLFAQIELNGFCRNEFVKTGGNMNRLSLVKINDDNISDLLLSGIALREVTEIFVSDTGFENPVNKYSFYPVDDIKLFDTIKKPASYILISRNDKRCAEISFRKNGSIKLLDELKFDTFPEVIETAESTGDSLVEAFICGKSFNGISQISLEKNRLVETKITSKRLFSDLAVTDLDFDGYPEIAALDFIDNKIRIFYNDGTGNYSELRSIEPQTVPEKIIFDDFDDDGFTDLLLSTKNGFELSRGDSVSSFEHFIKISGGFHPGKFVTGDFNDDGFGDIASLEQETGKLKILFNQNNYFQIYQPDSTKYLDIAKNEKNELFLLTEKSRVRKISRIINLLSEFTVSLSDSYTYSRKLNIGNDRFTDIAFIDQQNSELKIALSDDKNLFGSLRNYTLSSDFNKFYFTDITPWVKEFYLYTAGKKLIEILQINFLQNTVKTQQLYSYYPLIDLKAVQSPETGLFDISILAGDETYTGIARFFNRGIRYQLGKPDTLDKGSLAGKFLETGALQSAMIIKSDDTLTLKRTDFLPQKENRTSRISMKKGGSFAFSTAEEKYYSADIFLYKHLDTLSQIFEPGDRLLKIESEDKRKTFNLNDRFFKIPFRGNKRGLYKFDNISSGREIIISKIFESERINDYFISRFGEKYYLTFTLNNSNLIYFHELK